MIYDENKGFCSEILLLSCPHSVIINRQIKLWLHCLPFSLSLIFHFTQNVIRITKDKRVMEFRVNVCSKY